MKRTFPTLMQSMHNSPGHHYRGRVPLMMRIASTLMNRMPGMSTTSCSRCLRERQGGLPNYHVSAWERRVRAALAEVISFGHKANCWAGLLTYEASCHGKVTRQMSRHVDQNDASYSAKRCTLCHLSMHQCRCARLWR